MTKILLFDSKGKAEKIVGLHKIVKLQIDDVRFCLTRNGENYFAFEEKCPHMSEDLSKGRINPYGEVVCPWHDYRFSLATGEETKNRCVDLKRYAVFWEEGGLYVEI
ncbi:hypothetical protein BFP72_17345 [Reichenbachiella sp. 5M10]|uniref:Rieske (2Fe-2S) protein n=1 Tax=Reichenbachiella sp. 5M10 TaxID=1889772 RepID=UPI000C15FE06|nr:Rieske (2Fe-2S) protein [Reichenbachiella sp. 5M10]PIB37043.1 hypothetical protein BFP72_17345 [Reichenbachiella sp. 5M10]